jgi:hypothetical protein
MALPASTPGTSIEVITIWEIYIYVMSVKVIMMSEIYESCLVQLAEPDS